MMRKHIIFKISLMLMSLTFVADGADFGIFKSEWTKYPVNQKKTVVTETMFIPKKDTRKKPVKPDKSIYDKYGNIFTTTYEEEMEQYEKDLQEYNNPRIVEGETKTVASTELIIKSISLKCIGSEADDLKSALRGEKTYHCALRVEADIESKYRSDLFCLKINFYDEDGIYLEDAIVSVSGETLPIAFYKDRSHGVPTTFKIDGAWTPNIKHSRQNQPNP